MACIFINLGGHFINTRQPWSVFVTNLSGRLENTRQPWSLFQLITTIGTLACIFLRPLLNIYTSVFYYTLDKFVYIRKIIYYIWYRILIINYVKLNLCASMHPLPTNSPCMHPLPKFLTCIFFQYYRQASSTWPAILIHF